MGLLGPLCYLGMLLVCIFIIPAPFNLAAALVWLAAGLAAIKL